MERSIREANASLTEMRTERVKTIEAHQSRIKQLQDRFVEDIKRAGETEASRVEAELRRQFADDKDLALKELRQQMRTESEEGRQKLLRQIEALKASNNTGVSKAVKQVEEEWGSKIKLFNEEMAKLKVFDLHVFGLYQPKLIHL